MATRPRPPKMDRISIAPAKPRPEPEPVPDIHDVFLPEYAEELAGLLQEYQYYKAQMAEAKDAIDGDEKANPPVVGLKSWILGMMEECEVAAFQADRLKWSRYKSSRSTISREKLIKLGVDAKTVDAATSKSEFWILGLDTISEQE